MRLRQGARIRLPGRARKSLRPTMSGLRTCRNESGETLPLTSRTPLEILDEDGVAGVLRSYRMQMFELWGSLWHQLCTSASALTGAGIPADPSSICPVRTAARAARRPAARPGLRDRSPAEDSVATFRTHLVRRVAARQQRRRWHRGPARLWVEIERARSAHRIFSSQKAQSISRRPVAADTDTRIRPWRPMTPLKRRTSVPDSLGSAQQAVDYTSNGGIDLRPPGGRDRNSLRAENLRITSRRSPSSVPTVVFPAALSTSAAVNMSPRRSGAR